MVFLNSNPLVEVIPNKLTEVNEYRDLHTNNMFIQEFEKFMTFTRLKELGKNLNIKYEILNIKQLYDIRDFGCRVLVI